MQKTEIIEVIQQLPLDEQRRIAEEILRKVEEQVKLERRQAILALAGSWKGIADEDTADLLEEIRQNRSAIFNRKFDL